VGIHGPIGRWIRTAQPYVVSIDHHHVRAPFGDLDIVVGEAAATGEILYRFFKAVGAEITPRLAEALYSSILFDTWGFRLPNTNNETVRLASELLAYGIDHRRICADLFEADTLPKIDLLRLALGSLAQRLRGKAGLAGDSGGPVPRDRRALRRCRWILDHLLGIREVQICVMFREQENRGIKATFRSKGRHDVGTLAENLGGGGRSTASGVLLPMNMGDAMDCVLPLVYGVLARAGDPEALRRLEETSVGGDAGWSLPGQPLAAAQTKARERAVTTVRRKPARGAGRVS